MQQKRGKFVISLDFELMWGVRDLVTIETYGNHVKGVHTVLPHMLQLFSSYKVNATFAAVGFLFFENRQQLLQSLPQQQPQYNNPFRSPYGDYINNIGESFETDPYHFGSHLIKAILATPGQELGTHTFSHYYCMETGQTVDDFREDLCTALRVAREQYGVEITSIIFPRNQYDNNYLKVCKENGIICVRGNEHSWVYEPRPFEKETLLRRACRLLDAYINISGHHCYSDEEMVAAEPVNIPSSRFLRQYKPWLRLFESLRLRRIKRAMTYAARHNKTYHLWWHPHNFGINQDKNIAFLEKILQHYQELARKYDFTSYTMTTLAKELKAAHGK